MGAALDSLIVNHHGIPSHFFHVFIDMSGAKHIVFVILVLAQKLNYQIQRER